MSRLYDSIGAGYGRHRRADPRIGSAILSAIEGFPRIVNVGAGTGSYEPRDRFVVAVEPSAVMIRQRPTGAAPAIRAAASALPFRDGSFDAALAILTIHHWGDWRRGVRELARVARQRVVLLTWDPSHEKFWLVWDYFPEILAIDREKFPSLDALGAELGPIRVEPVSIPGDCSDGFLGAYWRRPEAYLDPSVRRSISSFAAVRGVEEGLRRLRQDIESGEWSRRYGALLGRESMDLGYRLVIA
jgi:SAM-dependent methyltransferase